MQKNFQESLINELQVLTAPLIEAANDIDCRRQFFHSIGWDVDVLDTGEMNELQSLLSAVDSGYQLIVSLVQSPPQSIEEVIDALDTTKQFFDAIQQLSDFSLVNSIVDLGDLGKDIAEYLTSNYLFVYHEKIFYALVLVGVIRPFYEDNYYFPVEYNDAILRNPSRKSTLGLTNISTLLSDPVTFIKQEYGFPLTGNIASSTDSAAIGKKLFERLANFLRSIGVRAAYGYRASDGVDFGSYGNELSEDSLLIMLSPPDEVLVFGIVFTLSPADRGDLGVVISPFGAASYEKVIDEWQVSASFSTGLPGFAIGPDGFLFDPSFPELSARIAIGADKLRNEDDIAILLGSATGTHFKVGGFSVLGKIDLEQSRTEYGLAIDITEGSIVVQPADGDGFLKKILPPDGMEVEFDMSIAWSNLIGLHIKGGAGLEQRIPVHKTIFNTIHVDNVLVSIVAGTPAIHVNLAASGALNLGPLTIAFQDVGIKSDFSFPSGVGNLGLLNVDLGFKPPSGAGISISSPAITGGGFLSYDEDTKTYTGALELSFKKFSLQAFGIISTQLPDGSEGYSLLIFITAQFQPFPIGMGFTLNGVGGMLGLNRRSDKKVLREGIRDNTLSNLLFPTDIIADASSIISTANQAFPVDEGRFVFGPLAKLGWGSPNILTIDLGIVIEVPDPVTLTILGVLKSILPDEDHPTLRLQVNFMGLIDFDKKQLSFDASIYDSKLLTYTLSGDMAVRLSWGNQPNFLLSVGGFHPQFTPPPLDLPELRRIAVQIFNEENLRVRFESYFALTSNSAQFGAKLDAYAAAGKYNAMALLWFDVLFQFSPFHMLAGMGVQVSIRRNDKVLLGAYLSVTVSGPGPWRVWGEVAFEICKCNFSIHFDKTFGEGSIAENLAVNMISKMQEALDEPKNWTGELPERNNQLVALREAELAPGTLFVSPAGNLTFRQQSLPLDVLFSKFGNAKLADFRKFSITNARDANNNALTSAYTTDYFAANEFYYLSDAEKLARPSYELYKSGVNITGTGNIKSSYAVHREFIYEDIVIDIRQRVFPAPVPFSSDDFEAQLNNNTISQSPFAAVNSVIPHNASPRVSVSDRSFTLASVDDLTPYTTLSFSSETEAEQYLSSLVASNANLIDQLIVVDQLELVA